MLLAISFGAVLGSPVNGPVGEQSGRIQSGRIGFHFFFLPEKGCLTARYE